MKALLNLLFAVLLAFPVLAQQDRPIRYFPYDPGGNVALPGNPCLVITETIFNWTNGNFWACVGPGPGGQQNGTWVQFLHGGVGAPAVWSGAGIPGSFPLSVLGDFYINTAASPPAAYQCFKSTACNAVSPGNWQLPASGGGGGPVTSVFGRTGVITATGGDYLASQVTNAVDSTQTYSNPAWITALAASKLTGLGAAVTGLGALSNNTTGNAATSSAFASTPSLCSSGQVPTGVAANGNATGCAPLTSAQGIAITGFQVGYSTDGNANKVASQGTMSGTAGAITCDDGSKNVTTSGCPTVPSIVAVVDLTGQTALIATSTALFTPSASGVYRFSYIANVTTAATSSDALAASTTIIYTNADSNVSETALLGCGQQSGNMAVAASGNTTNTTQASCSGTMDFNAKTGVAVTWGTGYTSVGGTPMTFAFHAKVEKLF